MPPSCARPGFSIELDCGDALPRPHGLMPFLLMLAVAAAQPRFKVQPLTVEGEVASVTATDLDGDGKKDLLAVYTTGLPPYQKRFIAIFWNRNGVFAPRPDLVMPVSDEEACAFDVGPTSTATDDLLMITPRGVQAQSFPGRVAQAKRVLLEHPTLFHQPIEGQLPRLRVVQDLSAPGASITGSLVSCFRTGVLACATRRSVLFVGDYVRFFLAYFYF